MNVSPKLKTIHSRKNIWPWKQNDFKTTPWRSDCQSASYTKYWDRKASLSIWIFSPSWLHYRLLWPFEFHLLKSLPCRHAWVHLFNEHLLNYLPYCCIRHPAGWSTQRWTSDTAPPLGRVQTRGWMQRTSTSSWGPETTAYDCRVSQSRYVLDSFLGESFGGSLSKCRFPNIASKK